MSDIFDNIDKMIPLLEKQIALYKELKRTLRIANLLGVTPKGMTGRVWVRVIDTSPSYMLRDQPWKKAVLRIRHNGEARDFPLADVPQDLWPEEYVRAWKRYPRPFTKQGD